MSFMEVDARAVCRQPDLNGMIVGEGNGRPRLQASGRPGRMADKVVLSGLRTRRKSWACGWLIGALPGRGEGFVLLPRSVIAACPAVGSQLDGSREALPGGELGELAGSRRPASIRTCILRMLDVPIEVPLRLSYLTNHFQGQ